MTVKLLTFLFDLLLPLVVGYVLVRRTSLTGKSLDPLVDLTMMGIVPMLAFLSFWNVELDLALLSLPFLGLAMQLMPGGFAWWRASQKSQDSLERGSYVLSNLLCNRGVLGGLAVFILFGEEAYAYSRLVIVLGLPVLLGVGFPIANYYHSAHYGGEQSGQGGGFRIFDKRQIALLGLAAGAALNLGGIPRPELLGTVFAGLVHVVAWTLLLPVGASIKFTRMQGYWREVADIVPLRFVFCPIVFYIIGRLLGLEGTRLHTIVVLSATPTAINAVITAKLYKLNVHLATAAFVLTTAVYLAVIFPLLLVLTGLLDWI